MSERSLEKGAASMDLFSSEFVDFFAFLSYCIALSLLYYSREIRKGPVHFDFIIWFWIEYVEGLEGTPVGRVTGREG